MRLRNIIQIYFYHFLWQICHTTKKRGYTLFINNLQRITISSLDNDENHSLIVSFNGIPFTPNWIVPSFIFGYTIIVWSSTTLPTDLSSIIIFFWFRTRRYKEHLKPTNFIQIYFIDVLWQVCHTTKKRGVTPFNNVNFSNTFYLFSLSMSDIHLSSNR